MRRANVQALDRTQPGLPMKPGRAGTMTHDYKRHGTTTLFAALNILDGTVIGRNMQRHRHQEFVRFLNTIEAQVPVGKVIHAVVDNYATHKHPRVRRWLARHPRWTFHFTPTSASWLNAVEGFFAKLTRQRLKRGVFQSVVDLQLAINRFVVLTCSMSSSSFDWSAGKTCLDERHTHPTAEWIARQITEAFPWAEAPRYLIRDRDRVYGATVTHRLRGRDKPIAPGSPWQNGFAERLIGSIRRECVDHVIVLGEAHLRRILTKYAAYYNELRTHRSLGKDAPIHRAIQHVGRIASEPVVGGLKAAVEHFRSP